MKKFSGKGQIFSVDFLAASMVFLFIILTILAFTNTVFQQTVFNEKNELDETAILVANSLLYSQGEPANWHTLNGVNEISNIGIVEARNVIAEEKLERLVDLNQNYYGETKDILGASKYGIRVSILRMQNNQSIAEFGLEPLEESIVSTANRLAYYNGENVIARIRVFKE